MSSVDRVRERLAAARERLDEARDRGPGGGPSGGPGFDPARVGPGERIAAASGFALVVLMLFDWFLGGSAWQLKRIDLLLFLLAAFAVGFAVSRAVDWEPVRRDTANLALLVAGAIALGIMVTLLFESTGGTVWLVLSFVAAGGILYGGLLALRPPSLPPSAPRRAQAPRDRGPSVEEPTLEREPPPGRPFDWEPPRY